MIEVTVFPVTMLYTNCYLIKDIQTGNLAVVDPGARSERLIKELDNAPGKLEYVILTHGHYDHIGYAKQLADKYGAKIVCSENSKEFLSDSFLNHSVFHDDFGEIKPFDADIYLKDGETFMLGSSEFKFILTPGHTKDSGCFIHENHLFCGDTLFCESYGRTDLPTGNDADMINSIRRLKNLDGDFNVYPGHGMMSTLDHERKYNPLMRRV